MKSRKRILALSLAIALALFAFAVLFLRWANEAPPIEPLLEKLPHIMVATPANETPKLFQQLAGLTPAQVQPDVDALYIELSQITDETGRREFLHSHRDEILAACQAHDGCLRILYKIASYEEVYDPEVPDFTNWSIPNLTAPLRMLRTEDAKALILLCEAGLEKGDREPLHHLIDVLSMLYKWRKNQWQTLGIVSGIAFTRSRCWRRSTPAGRKRRRKSTTTGRRKSRNAHACATRRGTGCCT